MIFPSAATQGSECSVTLTGKGLADVSRLFALHSGLAFHYDDKDRRTIKASPDAAVGQAEVWAVTPTGVSNPRFFAIDRLPHATEREPNDTPPQATVVKAPIVVDGVAAPNTDRDCFRFTSKAGQRWTIVCRSRSLDGTLDPTLTVIDPDGHEIEHYDGALIDARLHFIAAKAGDYTIAVQDRAYRDRRQNSYSLTITDGPYLQAAMPPMLERGRLCPKTDWTNAGSPRAIEPVQGALVIHDRLLLVGDAW
jgi:hypothetical protein